ncbi:serine/threonine protein kinase [Gaeumannomyces tritici R3-111a-1]|uniref:Serine/threonine protein kinase n=1 Tax=Gaeumannomyces tritici (strain R3-111a-1) TaxID=644352 RepID=J3P6H1_GAET3|nr:serine/threonine protein kinase [Gaeumannomyces tritici R3-111a-1]EJT72245.1 serine/threonine protein kinase [Gaeumannomyces tritici R3-111a-1]
MTLIYHTPYCETLRGDEESPAAEIKHVYMPAPPQASYTSLLTPVTESIVSAAKHLPRELFSRGLRKWLPEPKDPLADRWILKDAVFAEIKQLLIDYGRASWSYCPRTFSVLWIMGVSDETIDRFMADDRTDHYLPYNEGNLPDVIRGAKLRGRFLALQKSVRCKREGDVAALEAGGKHVTLSGDVQTYFYPMMNLGRGRFAQVDKVYSCQTTKTYARKMIHRGQSVLEDMTQLAAFQKELKTLKTLSHRHVVQLVGSYTHPTHLGLIMSPVADYDLLGYLLTDQVSSDDRKRTLRGFFGCLVTALAYIHSKKVRHKDIKPSNILVKDGQILLADFGTSRICLDGHLTTNGNCREGTPRYWAPEVMDGADRNTASDIWSLGCVFLEMATILLGHTHDDMLRFFERRGTEDPHRICLNPLATELWIEKLRAVAGFDHAVLGWISMMLRPKSDERPTAAQLRGMVLDARSQFDYICPECASVDGIFSSESPTSAQLVHGGALQSSGLITQGDCQVLKFLPEQETTHPAGGNASGEENETAAQLTSQPSSPKQAAAAQEIGKAEKTKPNGDPPPPQVHEQEGAQPRPKSSQDSNATGVLSLAGAVATVSTPGPTESPASAPAGKIPKKTRFSSTSGDEGDSGRFRGLPLPLRPETTQPGQTSHEVEASDEEFVCPDRLSPPPFRHSDCLPLPRASLVPSYILAGTNHFSPQEIQKSSASSRAKYVFVYGRLMFPSVLNAIASQSTASPFYSPILQRRLRPATEDWGKADWSIQRASELMTPAKLKGYDRWRPQGLDCAVIQRSAEYTESILRRRGRKRYRKIQPSGEVVGFLIVGLRPEALRYLDLLFSYSDSNLSSLNPAHLADRSGGGSVVSRLSSEPEGAPLLQGENVSVEVELNNGRVATVDACTYVWSQGAMDLLSPWSEENFVRGSEFQAMLGSKPERQMQEMGLARTMQVSFSLVGDFLAHAVLEGDLEDLEAALDHRKGSCDPNAPCRVHGTALQVAVVAGRGDMVELQLKHGANVNPASGGRYGTPLIAAACASRKGITRMLLEHGADVYRTHGEHVGALYQAVGHSDYTVTEMLLEHGAWLAEDWGEILDLAAEVGDDEIGGLLASYDVLDMHRRYLLARPDRVAKIARQVPYGRILEAVAHKCAAAQTVGGRWRGRKGVAVVAAALNAGAPVTILSALRRAVRPVQELFELLRRHDEMEEREHERAIEKGGDKEGGGSPAWEMSDYEEDEDDVEGEEPTGRSKRHKIDFEWKGSGGADLDNSTRRS